MKNTENLTTLQGQPCSINLNHYIGDLLFYETPLVSLFKDEDSFIVTAFYDVEATKTGQKEIHIALWMHQDTLLKFLKSEITFSDAMRRDTRVVRFEYHDDASPKNACLLDHDIVLNNEFSEKLCQRFLPLLQGSLDN